MRVLHIASFNSAVRNIGVVRQMQAEREAATDLGLDWDVELWSSDEVEGFDFVRTYPTHCNSRLARRLHFFRILESRSENYDLILLRYLPADPFLPFFRTRSSRLMLVLHTKDSVALQRQFPRWKGVLFALFDCLSSRMILRKANGLIAVTGDILEYHKQRARRADIPSIVIPNGISLHHFPLVSDNRSGKVKILFVASRFFQWNGLTDLLASMAEYSDRSSVELHLVGEVSDSDLEFIRSAGLMDSTKLHGQLDIHHLRQCLGEADVGVASFGLGMAGLKEACTLKVREYLASGVPVYSGHVDVAFPQGFDFYHIGPPDVESIARYGMRMRSISRLQIRQSAEEFIDKKKMVSQLYDWALRVCR